MCFLHDANYSDSIWDYTPEQREAFWEELYATPGFPMWLCNYKEISIDEKANDLVTAFVTKKTKARVNDPWTADKLIPKNHGMCSSQRFISRKRMSRLNLICVQDSGQDEFRWKQITLKRTTGQMCA